MEMSDSKKILQLGKLPQKELHELTKTDNTVLATALIYSISELIVSSYLDQNMEPDIKEIVTPDFKYSRILKEFFFSLNI